MDKEIFMKISRLQLINWILQLFFLRVFKNIEKDNSINYGVLYFVVPFTGWYSDFITIGRLKFYHFK